MVTGFVGQGVKIMGFSFRLNSSCWRENESVLIDFFKLLNLDEHEKEKFLTDYVEAIKTTMLGSEFREPTGKQLRVFIKKLEYIYKSFTELIESTNLPSAWQKENDLIKNKHKVFTAQCLSKETRANILTLLKLLKLEKTKRSKFSGGSYNVDVILKTEFISVFFKKYLKKNSINFKKSDYLKFNSLDIMNIKTKEELIVNLTFHTVKALAAQKNIKESYIKNTIDKKLWNIFTTF